MLFPILVGKISTGQMREDYIFHVLASVGGDPEQNILKLDKNITWSQLSTRGFHFGACFFPSGINGDSRQLGGGHVPVLGLQ